MVIDAVDNIGNCAKRSTEFTATSIANYKKTRQIPEKWRDVEEVEAWLKMISDEVVQINDDPELVEAAV